MIFLFVRFHLPNKCWVLTFVFLVMVSTKYQHHKLFNHD